VKKGEMHGYLSRKTFIPWSINPPVVAVAEGPNSMQSTTPVDCRLLYVVGQLRDGGLERQLCYLLETMDRERHKPQVLVWQFREDEKYVSRIRALGVPLHGLSGTSSRVKKISVLRTLLRRLNPEVVHSYSFYTNLAVWYAAIGTKSIPMGSVRSDFHRSRSEYGSLGRVCARWPRHQIFNSFAAAESARQAGKYFVPKHVFVVRNGIDTEQFKYTAPVDQSLLKIIGIGSLSPVKRWDRLLRAASLLKQGNIDFRVQLVGDGPLRARLEAKAKELGVADRVEFVGRREEIPALLSQAEILAHTSENEGCPNVVMEAMACGRPVVAMQAGDIPSLIDEGKTGFIVDGDDAESFAQRITTLAANRALCRRMGEAGRAKAEKEFGLNRLLDHTFEAYRAAGWQRLN
jgi:glycosyltransferase involved in cell wall biosynthesis